MLNSHRRAKAKDEQLFNFPTTAELLEEVKSSIMACPPNDHLSSRLCLRTTLALSSQVETQMCIRGIIRLCPRKHECVQEHIAPLTAFLICEQERRQQIMLRGDEMDAGRTSHSDIGHEGQGWLNLADYARVGEADKARELLQTSERLGNCASPSSHCFDPPILPPVECYPEHSATFDVHAPIL